MGESSFSSAFTTFVLIDSVGIFLLLSGTWRYFVKAKQKGWYSLIPVFCGFKAYEIASDKKSWVRRIIYILLMSAGLAWMFSVFHRAYSSIPADTDTEMFLKQIISAYSSSEGIISIVLLGAAWILFRLNSFLFNKKLAKSFGHSLTFALGLTFCPIVFVPVLGYDKAEYIGETAEKLTVQRRNQDGSKKRNKKRKTKN